MANCLSHWSITAKCAYVCSMISIRWTVSSLWVDHSCKVLFPLSRKWLTESVRLSDTTPFHDKTVVVVHSFTGKECLWARKTDHQWLSLSFLSLCVYKTVVVTTMQINTERLHSLQLFLIGHFALVSSQEPVSHLLWLCVYSLPSLDGIIKLPSHRHSIISNSSSTVQVR